TILSLNGKIDKIDNSGILRKKLYQLIEEGESKIGIELSKVTYIDSGAINVLVHIYNKLQHNNGELVLIAPKENIRNLINQMGLEKIIKVYLEEEDLSNGQKCD
ncbi:MAG: STAS domain-containing protein, partial [Chitinivibrionales bacterium]